MLKKNQRLTSHSAFVATYRQKRTVSDEFFVLYGGKNKEEQNYPTRVGFVVSKKIHKRATKRNRIKRLARESYRNLLKNGQIPQAQGFTSLQIPQAQGFTSLIFLANEGALDRNYEEICSSVKNLVANLAIKYF